MSESLLPLGAAQAANAYGKQFKDGRRFAAMHVDAANDFLAGVRWATEQPEDAANAADVGLVDAWVDGWLECLNEHSIDHGFTDAVEHALAAERARKSLGVLATKQSQGPVLPVAAYGDDADMLRDIENRKKMLRAVGFSDVADIWSNLEAEVIRLRAKQAYREI